LKEALKGCWFPNNDEVQEAVHDCLCTKPKKVFFCGIRKYVDCWTKYGEKQGDYGEKWINCKHWE
jgi:hypothetical protein